MYAAAGCENFTARNKSFSSARQLPVRVALNARFLLCFLCFCENIIPLLTPRVNKNKKVFFIYMCCKKYQRMRIVFVIFYKIVCDIYKLLTMVFIWCKICITISIGITRSALILMIKTRNFFKRIGGTRVFAFKIRRRLC